MRTVGNEGILSTISWCDGNDLMNMCSFNVKKMTLLSPEKEYKLKVWYTIIFISVFFRKLNY